MLFDTHSHLDDRAFDPDRKELLASLPEKGIGLLMNPGCSLASSRNACELARRYDYIYAAVGSHPGAASSGDKHCVTFSIHLGTKVSFFPMILSTVVS